MRARPWLGPAAALLVPLSARAYLGHRVHTELEPALTRLVGRAVTVGGIDTELSGAVRLDRVRVTGLGSAGSIQAGFAPGDLLGGHWAPREVRVARPRLHIEIDRRGRSSLEPVLAHVAGRLGSGRRAAGPRAGPLRRVVVTGGDLVVDLGRRGRLTAAAVELVPRGDRLRLRSGPVRLWLQTRPWRLDGRFARAALDLSLPRLVPIRLLAVGGAGALASRRTARPGRAALDGVVLSGGLDGPGLELSGHFAGADPRAGIDLAARRAEDGAGADIDLTVVRAPLAVLAAASPGWIQLGDGRASGRVHLELARGRLTFDLDARLARVAAREARLGPRPVALDGHLEAQGVLRSAAGQRSLSLDHLAVERGGARIFARGDTTWRPGAALPRRGRFALTVPDSDCGQLLAAIPAGLRPALTGLALAGRARGSAQLAFDRAHPDRTHLAVDLDLDRCRVVSEAALADPATLTRPFEHTFPDGHRARVGAGPDYRRLGALPPYLVGAFVAAEDARFYRHHGFDLDQIRASLAIDLAAGQVVRGGSTISQQLVKNAFLGPQRTLARKLEEAVLTWRLEARLSKRLILERYLNLIELGEGHVFGVTAAARRWFGVDPAALTVRQAAFLAALTPAPHTLARRLHGRTRPDSDMDRRIDTVLRAMRRAGVISRAAARRALAQPLTLRAGALARSP